MRLRVQKEGTPGYMSVDSFQKESLLSQFLQFLSTQLDISLARVQLSSTHPRRTIQSELDCTLETVGIRSGDTLVAGESAQAFSPFFPFLLPKVEDDEVIVVDDENGDDDGGERVPSYAKETFGVDFLHTVEPGLLAEGDDNALFVVRRKVEADNSCLFHAVAIAIGCAYVNAIPYRTAVADMVIRHASELDEGILEKKPEEYAKWIVNEEKWGGEIEAMILAKWVFHIEIALVDVRTASMHVYGQSRNVKHRVYLLYNGIHYDPLALNPVKDGPGEIDLFLFSPTDIIAKNKFIGFAKTVQSSGEFTNVHSFTIRCSICREGLVGQEQAVLHAQKTGHAVFEEYR